MTECQKPACMGGFCGIVYTPQGTAIAAQKAGDCQSVVCDGQGNTASVAADADLPSDLNDCTTDTCTAGVPSFAQNPKGSPCNQLGGTLCTASAKCVQCLSASDCASGVCNAMNACVAAQCNDAVKNGAETDIDCGGSTCPACGYAKSCGAGTDCVSMQCASGKCAATCSDGAEDGLETDVDCGGPCAKCATGKKCGGGADCMSGHCTAGLCADVLVIGQVQSRGDNGGSDEFVEIYNPTSIPVIFDATWTLRARNATGGLAMCASNSLATRFTGSGQSIPPHGHILFVNTTVPSYNGPTPGDGTYSTSIPDAASVVLQHGNTVIDALCFYFDATTQGTLTGCSGPYICEGTPITNPHNNTSGTNADASLERKPGGAAGNTVDTNDNGTDFATNAAADPHDLASAPTP